MAQTHNALDASLLGPAIRAALGVRDGTETIERFSETLQPTIDLWRRYEWARLRSETLWTRSDQIIAVAAQNSQAYVVNPSDSGYLVMLDEVWVRGSINAIYDILYNTAAVVDAALASSVQAFSRDLRGSNTIGQKLTRCHIREGTAAGLLGSTVAGVFSSPAIGTDTDAQPKKLEIVIPPGFAVGIADITVNHTTNWWFRGRERKALRGELDT